jgi:hypothetical protein
VVAGQRATEQSAGFRGYVFDLLSIQRQPVWNQLLDRLPNLLHLTLFSKKNPTIMYLPIQVKPVLRRRNFSIGKVSSVEGVIPCDGEDEEDDGDMGDYDGADDMDEDYDE